MAKRVHFQSGGIGCLQCSIEDSDVSPRISGKKCCALIAASAMGLARHRPSLHFTQNLGSFQRIKLSPNYLWYTCAASSTMINPVGNLGDSRLALG